MIRIKSGKFTNKRHKKIIKLAKRYRGSQSKLFKIANQRTMKSMKNSYFDRKKKKSFYKKLWVNRINIFCHQYFSNYNKSKKILKTQKILLNTKVISNLCIVDPYTTKKLLSL